MAAILKFKMAAITKHIFTHISGYKHLRRLKHVRINMFIMPYHYENFALILDTSSAMN